MVFGVSRSSFTRLSGMSGSPFGNNRHQPDQHRPTDKKVEIQEWNAEQGDICASVEDLYQQRIE